uniref:Uncharacterized protein n=1 Tax=Oryza punctata TaxID=4537 RepID=A0A0E0M600_ORYPU
MAAGRGGGGEVVGGGGGRRRRRWRLGDGAAARAVVKAGGDGCRSGRHGSGAGGGGGCGTGAERGGRDGVLGSGGLGRRRRKRKKKATVPSAQIKPCGFDDSLRAVKNGVVEAPFTADLLDGRRGSVPNLGREGGGRA